MTFEQMWRDLLPVGLSTASGGYFRQPFTPAEQECQEWFSAACATRGLRIDADGFGNRIAWWDTGDVDTGDVNAENVDADRRAGVVTGSHLDSVLDGGAYDGPLGVVSALAAMDLLRERGFSPARPVGVAVFAEEEGSRFGRACLGSRLAAGADAWDDVRGLTDRDGVRLGDVTDAPGRSLLRNVGCFVELHVEQGRDLVERDEAVGVASGIWPHGRYRFAFSGEANHAGTTRMEDRRDPMLTFAMTALAANKAARLAGGRTTFGRVEVRPNGTNAVPSGVTAWLDARAGSAAELEALVEQVRRQAADRAARDGTTMELAIESVSPPVAFDPDLARRVAGERPLLATAAGHDAGVLSAAGIAAAMLFVRNPTGISHSPQEHAEMSDCIAGVEALADVIEDLAGAPA